MRLSLLFSLLFAFSQDLSQIKRLEREGKWREAAKRLDKILERFPHHRQALLLRVKLAVLEMDLGKGEKYLRLLFKNFPKDPVGLYYLGRIHYLRREYKQAEKALLAALRKAPKWWKPYVLLGWVYIRERKLRRALFFAKTAQRLARTKKEKASVNSLLAYLAYRQKRLYKARVLFQKAYRQDPTLSLPHLYLGCGLGPPTTNGLLRNHPKDFQTLKEGIQRLEQGEYSLAFSLFLRLLRRYPGNATCHFLAYEALKRKVMSKHRIQTLPVFQFLQKLYFQRGISEKTARRFFVGYEQLSPWEKRVLRAAAYPFARYIPRLLKKGIRHYILPLDKRLSELPGKFALANQATPDGRRFGDIRGMTDKNAISGRETIWNMYVFHYATVVHEIAHQVHMYALPHHLQEKIQRLYRQALRKKRYLDYYAALSVFEYFAQGVEAYFSLFKRPGTGPTACHTRWELKEKDPKLYRLLEKILLPRFSKEELFWIYLSIAKLHETLSDRKRAEEAYRSALFVLFAKKEESPWKRSSKRKR